MPTKVLVFESDSAFASELRAELGKLGCMTTVVDDGNAGLQAAASDRPDLILLSIELPRMNGFSVCNKLKKDAALREERREVGGEGEVCEAPLGGEGGD